MNLEFSTYSEPKISYFSEDGKETTPSDEEIFIKLIRNLEFKGRFEKPGLVQSVNNVPMKTLENMRDAIFQLNAMANVTRELKPKGNLEPSPVNKSVTVDVPRAFATKQEAIGKANALLKRGIVEMREKMELEKKFFNQMEELSREWLIHKGNGNWIINGITLEKENGELIVPLKDSLKDTLNESLYGKVSSQSRSLHETFTLDLQKELFDQTKIDFQLFYLEKDLSLLRGLNPPNILVRRTKIYLGSVVVSKRDLVDYLE